MAAQAQNVGEDAEVGALRSAGGGEVGLGEFAGGGVEADAESFGFAGPGFALCFGDAGHEVVADLFEAVALGGVDPQHPPPNAGVLVDARCQVYASAVAERLLAALEVAEELVPFGVGGERYSSPGQSLRHRRRWVAEAH
jgi:hypothetical protein